MDVDQVLDAQASIDELLDLFDADFIHVAADAIAVVGHLIHHLAAGLAEPIVVLEEVAVAVDVGHHQLLIDEVVALHQVGVARIVVDHHLVDLLQAVMVTLAEPLVFHAEPPMRIADRKARLGRDRVEIVGVDVLEDRGVEVEAVASGVALDLALHVRRVGRQVGGGQGDMHDSPIDRQSDRPLIKRRPRLGTWRRSSYGSRRIDAATRGRVVGGRARSPRPRRGLSRGDRGAQRGRGRSSRGRLSMVMGVVLQLRSIACRSISRQRPLPRKSFDRFVNGVLVFDFRKHERRMLVAEAALQVAQEFAAAVRTIDLPVAEQVHDAAAIGRREL